MEEKQNGEESPNEKTSPDDPADIINQKSEIPIMEVHAHTHPPPGGTGRKKWTHYLFEFLMLFLAITLGFFVENQREHYIEHRREKQYIRSYLEDLKTDIIQLDSIILKRNHRKITMDSLNYMLDLPEPDIYGKQIYYYTRWLTIAYVFFNNDRTIQQLKNGGNLRLIRNQEASDAIMAYDRQVRWLVIVTDREQEFFLELVKKIEEIFDSRVFNKMATGTFGFNMPEGEPRLLKKDKLTIQQMLNKIHFLNSVNSYLLMTYNDLLNRARQTKAIIEKEYY